LKIDTIRRLVADGPDHRRPGRVAEDGARLVDSASTVNLIAIGASAGGPAALTAILGDLPCNFPAGIVIVQHVDEQFVPLLAGWLNSRSALSVRVARQGDKPESGTVLIAGTNDHLIFVNSRSLGYTSEPRECCYRPSVDVFFESVVRQWKGPTAGVLLTGMGSDGAKGLKALRKAGSLTIAQDRASCVVYGMPKAAMELNAASEILPVSNIANRLLKFVTYTKR
jgi:two-component system response regulator WspF